MELVRRRHHFARLGFILVIDLPPPLMAGDFDSESVRVARVLIVERVDRTPGEEVDEQEHEQNDDARNDGSDDDLREDTLLWREGFLQAAGGCFVGDALSPRQHREKKKDRDENEDHRQDPEVDPPKSRNAASLFTSWTEGGLEVANRQD